MEFSKNKASEESLQYTVFIDGVPIGLKPTEQEANSLIEKLKEDENLANRLKNEKLFQLENSDEDFTP